MGALVIKSILELYAVASAFGTMAYLALAWASSGKVNISEFEIREFDETFARRWAGVVSEDIV
jgi:hypothetical protein